MKIYHVFRDYTGRDLYELVGTFAIKELAEELIRSMYIGNWQIGNCLNSTYTIVVKEIVTEEISASECRYRLAIPN